MKQISAALLAKLTSTKTEPIWMIELQLSPIVYFTTGTDLTFQGNSYSQQDFVVPNPTIGNNVDATGKVIFQGIDNVFTALIKQPGVIGSVAILHLSVQGLTYNADDVVTFLRSEIDSYEVNPDTVTVNMKLQPIIFPSEIVNADSGFFNVDPPGTYVLSNGVLVLKDARFS